MFNSVNLNDKTYEELMAEAVAQIPLYSREWTNFNVSDPGMTILQNLTAFQLVQQEAINDVPEEARRKLLKLLGYTSADDRAASILVQAPPEGGAILPAGYQLWSGAVPFETTEEISLSPWGLREIYSAVNGTYRDLTRFLKGGADAYPFGRTPAAGNAFVCLLSGRPEMGEPIRLWLKITEEELRTPFEDASQIPAFSRVRWQYYTAGGWANARFEDETMGLLRSGMVTLWLEGEPPAVLEDTPVAGCAFRCLLEEADYDRAPRLQSLAAHLFPMKQQHTRVQCFTRPGGSRVELRGHLPQLGNLMVFCREQEEGPYYLYKRTEEERSGRFYRVEETFRGAVIRFGPEGGPCEAPDAVRVVCYDEEMIHHRRLGPVYGYDQQVVQLELVEHVLEDSLLLALEVPQPDGETAYWFVRPGETGVDGFSCHLRSAQAQLVIDEPGPGGSSLLLAHCAVTQGSRGNLRAGAVLEQRGGYDGTEVEASFDCPAPGRGGTSYESEREVRMRFSAGMRRTVVAVRREDYENLVRQVPGLCIHKVRAVTFASKNLVKIAVKPYTEEELPRLSENYLEQIRAYLEPRRMLTTRFEICQPRYVPIGVRATLSIRGMEAYAREQIEGLIRTALDYVHGPQNFGAWVRFNELYQQLSQLPFVEAVDMLNLYPEQREAELVGSDIRLEEDSLCYPGTIQVTLREHGR